MSFIDEQKVQSIDNPNFFKIGDISLSVPIQNIEISRHENFQTVSYLRDLHSMKIHTGRSILRVNITFPILVDHQMKELQSLVAMTRITPFVPIQNHFLQGQFRIYDNAPESFELNHTIDPSNSNVISSEKVGNLHTADYINDPTNLEALPMAILGMAVTMGGDSPEIAECSMSFTYWNPMPWFGIDLKYWKGNSLAGLNNEYTRYIKRKISTNAPSTFDSTVLEWWDVKLYSELTTYYDKQLRDAKVVHTPVATDISKKGKINIAWANYSTDDSPDVANQAQIDVTDQNVLFQQAAQRMDINDFIEGIAAVESSSYKQDKGWDTVNTYRGKDGKSEPTYVAGRYQIAKDTWENIFFNGADVIGHRPVKDIVKEEWTEIGAPNDPWLKDMVNNNHGSAHYKGPTNSPLKSKQAFAEWYARPEMAGIQTLVTREYGKYLLNKHDGDAMRAMLEYFLGLPGATEYINHWTAHKEIKTWTGKDENSTKAKLNVTPLRYAEVFTKGFVSDVNNLTKAITDVVSIRDINTASNQGSGPIAMTHRGDIIASIRKPIISAGKRKVLDNLGWRQISTTSNGKPNPDLLNPLFVRKEPHLIDLATGNIFDTENQVITSISIAFQNKFANLPMQGYPYPALQHMGSVDSEIRMTVACLSDSQEYRRLKQAQHMMHTMALRARKYRGHIYDSKEILLISRLRVTNRLLNALGIEDVIITDLAVQIDPESSNLARGEFMMTENAFDIDKERLYSSSGKNNADLRGALRKIWLKKELFNKDGVNPKVQDLGIRLRQLQLANDEALSQNKDILSDDKNLDRSVAALYTHDAKFRKMFPIKRESRLAAPFFANPLTPALNTFNIGKLSYLQANDAYTKTSQEFKRQQDIASGADHGLTFKSALYIQPHGRALLQLDNRSIEYFRSLASVRMPINPSKLLQEGLASRIGNWFEDLYTNGDKDFSPGDPGDIDKLKGAAATLLGTSYGRDMLQAWREMNQSTDLDIFREKTEIFFQHWSDALHEWYNTTVLEDMLLFLYKTYEHDPSFASITDMTKDIKGGGIYRDLMLDQEPHTNPYSWLDDNIEPVVQGAIQDIVDASLLRIERITEEYDKMQRRTNEDPIVRAHDATYDLSEKDMLAGTKTEVDSRNFGVQSYSQSIRRAQKNVSKDARNALYGLRDFSPVQFTMRRAFPAFRFYFIEEDNQGILKRFDDFYSYNAVSDIQMMKYKNRPATMIVTVTNLFGHLDSKVFDDMTDRDAIKDATNSALNEGDLPRGITEINGVEYNVHADGSMTPLSEIMLRPGTKVVMKLGYDNDPDNLPTTFAGQVTEISGGDIMTIVCQDWTSEMFANAAPQGEFSVPLQTGWWKNIYGTSSTWDIQGTTSARTMLAAIMRHRSVQHFGHWQIKNKGATDSNYFGYQPESNQALKLWDYQLSNLFRMFSGDRLTARTRALANINPQGIAFYTAWGTDLMSLYPTKEEIRQMSLWDLIQQQRMLLPNHIAMVRPFGQGDATLYFGPPWGVYQADQFNDQLEQDLFSTILHKTNKDIFHELISIDDATMIVNKESEYILKRKWDQTKLGQLFQMPNIFNLKETTSKRDHTESIPIGKLIMAHSDILFDAADYKYQLTPTQQNDILSEWENRFDTDRDNIVQAKIAQAALGNLTKGASPAVTSAWYDIIVAAHSFGGIKDDEGREAILIDTLQAITQAMRSKLIQKDMNDPEFDPNGLIRKAIKPVRQWHLVNSQQHIIANNIQINNNFANEVSANDVVVRYDPELLERRRRHADKEIPESIKERPLKLRLYLTSILAEEMRNMYSGELILAGNAEIEPHDIIMIFDDIRHIHGAIEVAKVHHIFNQEMGFITIVQPHLIVEQGDYSMSTAIASAMYTFTADLVENDKTKAGKIVNAATAASLGAANQLHDKFIAGGPLVVSLLPPIPLLTGRAFTPTKQKEFAVSYIISQLIAPHEARNHPLTIFPLVKRVSPWLGGIEGASGRGMLGQIGQTFAHGLKNAANAAEVIKTLEDIISAGGDLAEGIAAFTTGPIND